MKIAEIKRPSMMPRRMGCHLEVILGMGLCVFSSIAKGRKEREKKQKQNEEEEELRKKTKEKKEERSLIVSEDLEN